MDISGFTDSRFHAVEGLFREVVASQSDGGASFAAFVDGECVVNLVGGESAAGAPWTGDTISTIFSCTKGLVAVLVARLVQDGRCNPDSPVAEYWPEFSAVSPTLTVRGLLEHRAGLSATRADMSLDEVLAGGPVVASLLGQEPLWEPGTGYAYHSLTFGHLVGELIRRITGKSAGAYFQEVLAQPLNVAAYIGVPESEEHRVTELIGASDFTRPESPVGSGEYWDERAMTFGNAFPLADIGKPNRGFNLRATHQAELPGANGVTNTFGLAKMWSSVITKTDGVRTLSDETVAMMAERRVTGPSVWQDPGPWWGRGFGVMLATPGKPDMLSPASFGHDGLGGQAGWADPTHNAAVGFVSNYLLSGGTEHDRWVSLVAEVRRVLEA